MLKRCCTSQHVGVVRVRVSGSAWCARAVTGHEGQMCVSAGVSRGKRVEVHFGSVRVGRGVAWSGGVLGECETLQFGNGA